MPDQYNSEPLLDMFLFESTQLSGQLEQLILESEKERCLTKEAINEIFRIMHTIKGSAAMMRFENISTVAHAMEDMFYYIREETPVNMDFSSLSDLVLEGVDFIKTEMEKIQAGVQADRDPLQMLSEIREYLVCLKRGNEESKGEPEAEAAAGNTGYTFGAVIYFEEGCEMENVRAFTIVHNLKEKCREIHHFPDDIIETDESIQEIRKNGFRMLLKTDCSYEEMNRILTGTVFLRDLEFTQFENDEECRAFCRKTDDGDSFSIPSEDAGGGGPAESPTQYHPEQPVKHNGGMKSEKENPAAPGQQSIISVGVTKLDKLMDLVGEMVIAEAMVIQNPDLKGLELNNFNKAARQLNKITTEIQDIVMSIRMVPLSATFNRMRRIVRDMCRKLDKEVNLQIIGEDTEVDKNIIEHISDPLMHLVRNSLDHGIEKSEERAAAGKSKAGTITLEARNAGSDVVITVTDDGKGLNRESILRKAGENGLLWKSEEEMTDREVFGLILLPGFSTKENVTEFSGRGVGMDVVSRNIETVGGSLSVDSREGMGTVITLKIPLTLAIIDGINIKVGESRYTIPTISIKEFFRPQERDIINDPDGNEMIMVRGQCYSIKRLHRIYHVKTDVIKLTEGIIIMVEQDEEMVCIFADELLGQQQVVVKALPEYIQNFKKIQGLAGCTLLGDGSISLILDIGGLMARQKKNL